MKKIIYSLFLFAHVPGFADPAIIPQNFYGHYHRHFRALEDLRETMPAHLKAKKDSYRFVMVSGFLNERREDHFEDNIEELRAMWVPKEQIEFVLPSSKNSVLTNSQRLFPPSVQRLAAKGPQKLVFLAHSKGAAETLAWAIQNPEFIKEKVAAIFLLQGALGGSPIADYVRGTARPISDEMPTELRWMLQLAGRGEWLLTAENLPALVSLTPNGMATMWEGLRRQFAPAISEISPLVFYIRAVQKPEQMTELLRPLGWYLLTAYHDSSDGLVLGGDQSLPWIGTAMPFLQGDHMDFSQTYPLSRSGTYHRQALMRAIMEVLP
jgi:hypothetical protein